MKSARHTEQAELDLDSAWAYLALTSVDAADEFVREVLKTADLYARMPRMGRARDELLPGLRSFVVDRYIVFFRPVDDTIEIVRVLHGSRNLKADFVGD